MIKSATACPCGSTRAYAYCCARYHDGLPAPDAEALMRSRYCAYVLGNRDYLLDTWHASTRPSDLELEKAGALRWLGLTVKRHQLHDANHASVEFVARSRSGGAPAQRLHEISRFLREDGRWYYVDGEFPAGPPRI